MNGLRPTALAGLLMSALAACSGPTGPSPGSGPSIGRFTATPAALTAPGPVTLAWEVSGATSLEIDHGVGSVTPLTSGSRAVTLDTTTTFTLTAKNASGSATAKVTASLNAAPAVLTIDPSLHPSPDTVGDGRGGRLPLAAFRDDQGITSEFIAEHLLIVPRDAAELSAFLARTGGTVVEDDTIPAPPPALGITLTDAERRATTYTVRVDASTFNIQNFVSDAAAVGLGGKVTLSSDLGARLLALSLSEVAAGHAVGLNFLSRPDAVMLRTSERPSGVGAFVDAFATTRFQTTGSRSNVLGAWQWIRARGTARRVRVAILDGGFWISGSGQPNAVAGIGSDLPANPVQYDFASNDTIVGDVNPVNCSGGNACPWHGNSAAGTALGLIDNFAGAAGTGGLVADPMLFHIVTTKGQQKWALSTARAWGADVISMSFGGACNYWCRREEDILGYGKEIERARNAGIVMVASAGNSGQNVDTEYVHPCNYGGVICVGALSDDGNTSQGYSNFGGSVDIWAPTNLPVMPHGSNLTVHSYGGTSASAPFVSGIAAMLKAVNPGLTGDQVRDLLRDMAWTDSPDGKVSHHVNALAAVKRASNNQLPPDRFEPNNDASRAALLAPGQYDDLNLDSVQDFWDYYRFDTGGPTLATIKQTSPAGFGKFGLAGLSKARGCGDATQVSASADKTQAVYRLPSGSFHFVTVGTGPVPYDLNLSVQTAPIARDAYEGVGGNDTPARKTSLDLGAVGATLHTASDVDYYEFYSQGQTSSKYFEQVTRARALGSDTPLTLRAYNSKGTLLGSATTSPDCSKLAELTLPSGFITVQVSGGAPGTYSVAFGSYISSVLTYRDVRVLVMHPDGPVELGLRDPVEAFVLHRVSDYPLASLTLRGAGLHMTLSSTEGQLLAEGQAHDFDGVAGETLTPSSPVTDQQTILKIERLADTGIELPGNLAVVPATLELLDASH